MNILSFLYITVLFFIQIIPILISIAYLTLMERKVLGYSQLRKGPNKVGVYGILQPLADGVKLFSKEILIPSNMNVFLYIFSPIIALLLSFIIWFFIPWSFSIIIINSSLSLLIIYSFSSLTLYSILIAGWSSESKYAFLGGIRATAQMIAYEVTISIILMIICSTISNFNIYSIIITQQLCSKYFYSFLPLFFLLFIISLAETNRAPFDLSEGESEIVSGYNVEYSSMGFALFFLAEYGHIIFLSVLISILFISNGTIYYLIFSSIIITFMFIWVRTSFPRFRYDHIMYLVWKNYLPILLIILFFLSIFLITSNNVPGF